MIHSVARSLLALLLLASVAMPAAAQTMTTTISGVVGANNDPESDVDTLGLFGPVGADLDGKTLRATFKFDASLMNEGGQSPGYSAWSGPSGSCAISIDGVHAKPAIDKIAQINEDRIYFYSDVQGTWSLSEFPESSTLSAEGCGVNVASTVHPFVPSAALVQSFSYRPPKKEQPTDNVYLDITVNGVRETVSASVKSLKYGP